jgi:ParB family chromosome partitioning protein
MGGKLGKGLGSLLQNNNSILRSTEIADNSSNELQQLDINFLTKGKYQPRQDMDQESLLELSESIKNQGMIQPIVVRRIGDHVYEIIAGERRWQAAKLAGLSQVPCLVKELSDRNAMIISLIENIQREDLNIVEEAEGLNRLVNELNLTHENVAEILGKSRSSISNLLRLNSLSAKTKDLLRSGDLEMGHARALLALEGEIQENTAIAVVQKALTVRETEKLVKDILHPKEKKETEVDESFEQLKSNFSQRFSNLNVKCIRSGTNKGKFVLTYKNQEELTKIKQLIGL